MPDGTKIVFTDGKDLIVEEELEQVADKLEMARFLRLTSSGQPVYVGTDNVAYLTKHSKRPPSRG